MQSTKRHETDTPLSSKKFIAFVIASMSWKALIVLMILNPQSLGGHVILLTTVIITGFFDVAYLLGQSYVDRYLKIADLAFDEAANIAKTLESAKGTIVPVAPVVAPVIPAKP